MSTDLCAIVARVKAAAAAAAERYKDCAVLPVSPGQEDFEDMWKRLEWLDTKSYESNIKQLFISRFDYEISLIIENDYLDRRAS